LLHALVSLDIIHAGCATPDKRKFQFKFKLECTRPCRLNKHPPLSHLDITHIIQYFYAVSPEEIFELPLGYVDIRNGEIGRAGLKL